MCKRASFRTNFVKNNAIFQNELGNTAPISDTIMAIGPTVGIAMVNSLIGYFERPSMNRVNLETMNTFLPFSNGLNGGADVQVIYDEFTSRFFALAWVNPLVSAKLTITSPSGVVGTYDARKMVNSKLVVFLETGKIVPTDPVDCYDPISATWDITPACQAAINGNIALIKRRSINLPLGPGNNAASVAALVRSYGAIGVILYDDVSDNFAPFGGLNELYPQISITKADGELLASSYGSYPPFAPVSPINGRMSALPISITKNYMNIAVSKTSTPLSTNDWYKYQFTTNYWLTANVFADYPKIAVDKESFYIATQDVNNTSSSGAVSVLKKNDLVTNFAPTYINESSSTFISQNTFSDSLIPQPARIVYSRYKDYLPQFFVALANYGNAAAFNRTLNAATGLRVFIGGSMSKYIDVPFPVPTSIDSGLFAPQPLSVTGAISFPLATATNVNSAVIYKNSIFCTHTVVVNDKQIARWYELDVSKAVSYNTITIKQWGDIDTSIANNATGIRPTLNVDKRGNMGILFTISGPNTLGTLAYTGRLKDDPLGTVRTPYQTIKVNPYPYNGAVQARNFSTGPVTQNRWEDYKGLVIDPLDHKTFFVFGTNSCDDQPPALPSDVDASKRALKWTTTMSSFNIKKR